MHPSNGHERDVSNHMPDQMLPQSLSGAPSAHESVSGMATVEKPVPDCGEQMKATKTPLKTTTNQQ